MALSRPEPMNASPHHSKVKVSLTMSDSLYIAGGAITGKMQVECRTDKGLGLGVMMVELYAIEELTSRDHSATSTFLRSKRLFQGQGLPPSNAVLPHPLPGEPPLPAHYFQARKGITTYLFRFPIPESSPSSINFGSGLATLRYEVRASVGVAWKGERRLVTDKKDVDVVEAFDGDPDRVSPEAVVVGEGGKIWAQGRVMGGVVAAGRGACVELQVKNHSAKKNTGLSVTLTRHLHLPNLPPNEKSPLQISDTLTHVAFKGPEYIAQPGTEGIATLVFDIPKDARSLKGGRREDDEEEGRTTEPLFEVRAVIGVKITMGIGSKDIYMELPVTIVHPDVLPPEPVLDHYGSPPFLPYGIPEPISPPMSTVPYPERAQSPYAYPAMPTSPVPPFMQPLPNSVWYPPHPSQTPMPYPYVASPVIDPQQPYFYPPPPMFPPITAAVPPRPSSAEPVPSQPLYNLLSGLPSAAVTQPPPLPPLNVVARTHPAAVEADIDGQEGKGERASRVSRHLRLSSRHRSVSPPSHRFALPAAVPVPITMQHTAATSGGHLSPNKLSTSPAEILSPRPMPSPKHTVTVDPFTRLSLTKSERVDLLEKIAAEVDEQNADMSRDIPKDIGVAAEVDKTLPGPPVPSGKDKALSVMASRPKAAELFAAVADAPADTDVTPPTPALHAVSPSKGARNAQLAQPSGLDVLEQKLLEQVGTRKPKEEEKRPDVRSILPIAIPPRPTDSLDPVNDSAISSLTLTGFGGESEDPTHRAHPLSGKTSHSAEDREDKGRQRSDRTSKDKASEKERRSGKKKERGGREVDAYKLRKAAKGRVAEWLGRIDPEVPPLVDTPPPGTPTPDLHPPADAVSANVSPALSGRSLSDDAKPPTVVQDFPKEDKPQADAAKNVDPATDRESEAVQKSVDALPNPRSSGFMPVATYRASRLRSQGVIHDAVDQAQASAPLSPPKSPVDRAAREAKKGVLAFPKPPINWPPPSDSGAKYDVRSARGGRGGKVTAITQIWSTAMQNGSSEVKTPAKPEPPKPKRIVSPLAASFPTTAVQNNEKAKAAKLNGDRTRRDPVGELKPKPALINRLEMPSPRAPVSLRPPFEGKKSPSPVSEPTSLGDLTARRARMIKSTSVPAILSSSLAKPTLSSTASLVKPTFDKPKLPMKIMPTVAESLHGPESKSAPPKSPPADLAFGQARLRDLIKKYQGQANS